MQQLSNVLAEFLTCSEPIRANVIAKSIESGLEIELVLLEPRDIKVLSRRAALELASNVFVVVADNPGDRN